MSNFATKSPNGIFHLQGKLIDSNGYERARIKVSANTVRTNWLDTHALDGYLAARDIPLPPGATYALELQTLEPTHGITVWTSHHNLEKSK